MVASGHVGASPGTPISAAGSSLVTLLSSAVPGRLRVRVEGLRRSPTLAARIVDRLDALPSVASARANPVTGSVLVIFDVTRVTAKQIVVEIVRCRAVATTSPGDDNGAPAISSRAGRRPARRPPPVAEERVPLSPEASGSGHRTSWHALDADAVTARLEVVPALGLSSTEAADRLAA